MINYIKFNIGGKERGFKLGLGFLGDILQHYATDMGGLGLLMVDNPFSVTPAILFYAHKHDCIRNGEQVDFQLHDVEDWIEEMPDTLNNENIEKLMFIMIDAIKRHLPKFEEATGAKKNRLGS